MSADLYAAAQTAIAARRALVEAGTRGPWVQDAFYVEGRHPWPGSRPGEIIAQALNTARAGNRADHEADAALIVAAVNAFAADTDALAAVLERHKPITQGPFYEWCTHSVAVDSGTVWPCPDATAALTALGVTS